MSSELPNPGIGILEHPGSSLESVFTKQAIAYFSDSTLRKCFEVLEPKAIVHQTQLQLSDFQLMPETPEVSDAVLFVESAFNAIGVGFHPDTDFKEYVNIESGLSILSEIDAIGLNFQMEGAMELLENEEESAYDICLRLAHKWYSETQAPTTDSTNAASDGIITTSD